MPKSASRDFVLKKNAVTLASITAKSVTWSGQPIDVTSDDSAGITEFLADTFGTQTMELQCDGFTDDDVLSDLAFSTTDADKHLSDLTLERPNGDVISGTFVMTSYAENGSDAGEGVTFSCTLVRSGAHTFTPAP